MRIQRWQQRSKSRAIVAIICLAGSISLAVIATAAERTQVSVHAVVTANPLATSAALQMLTNGGSAIDAAIAAQLVLGVVEPQSSGIGGGAVVLYRESTFGPVRAFDGLALCRPRRFVPGSKRLLSGNGSGTPAPHSVTNFTVG
jgi:hypothetical protein